MTQTAFEGRLSGGETASAVPVTTSFEADGLALNGAEGARLAFWKYQDLLPGAPIAKGAADVLVRNAHMPRATLFVSGPAAAELVIARAPQTSQGFQRLRVLKYCSIATAFMLTAALFLLLGGVHVAKSVAHLIPAPVLDRIAAQNLEILGPACINQPGNAALQRVLDRLQSGGNYGASFKLHVAQSSIPNALALPGRHIVLLSALLQQANSPEEVAGVIAHEMGHGLEEDPEAFIVRDIGTQTLLAFLTGESGNPLTAGALLLKRRYSRQAERGADAHAIEILRNARIDPRPTAGFFLRHSDDAVSSYLRTHPSSKDRAQLFLSQPAYPVEPVLSDKDWAGAQALCGAAPIKKSGEPRKLQEKFQSRKA